MEWGGRANDRDKGLGPAAAQSTKCCKTSFA
jgi:hypothetical protein